MEWWGLNRNYVVLESELYYSPKQYLCRVLSISIKKSSLYRWWCFMLLHLAFCYEWGSITTRWLFFRDKLRKQNVSKSAEFGLSQLNCSSTTTDGLTATTPSPSTLPWAIIILPPHLTFSPGSHPSCFSPAVSPQSTLLIYFTRPWSHIWTVLSLERQWP